MFEWLPGHGVAVESRATTAGEATVLMGAWQHSRRPHVGVGGWDESATLLWSLGLMISANQKTDISFSSNQVLDMVDARLSARCSARVGLVGWSPNRCVTPWVYLSRA